MLLINAVVIVFIWDNKIIKIYQGIKKQYYGKRKIFYDIIKMILGIIKVIHHHLVLLLAQISLIISFHPSLSSIDPGQSFPVSAKNCFWQVLAGQPTQVNRCEGIYRRISLMSSPFLLLHCPSYFLRLTWIVLEMGGKWPYGCCFVGCCFQCLLNIICGILVHFSISFFFIRFVSVHVEYPYRSTNSTAAWK